MPTITVDRVIAADPTGIALLLAGPAARDLWPGSREVVAPAPHRLPASYVTRFVFDGPPATDGVVTLTYEPAAGVATRAVLALAYDAPERGTAAHLRAAAACRALAGGFLANLATAAEERSYAA